MEYPKGTKFGLYILTNDGIRRQITLPDGKRVQPRHPKHLYKNLTTEAELIAYVNKLNHREDEAAKLQQEIRTSFIPQALKDEFRDRLKIEIPNEKDFRYLYNKLFQAYFLKYFVHTIKQPDPATWYSHQSSWGAALMGKADNPAHNVFPEKRVSFKTIKHTIQAANRFMKFLHTKAPTEYPLVIFDPISRGAQKAYKAEQQRTAKPAGKFITDADWKLISKNLPDDIAPFVLLMYHYGLRRGESLGFETTDAVKQGYLKVSQQMKTLGVYEPVKDKEDRETPHWFAKPIQAYNWITDGLDKKMHPDTLYVRWEAFMKSLKMDYDLHDLRRTFITKALRDHAPRDVQLAVGHSSLATTMGYAQDDRDLKDETFKPGS